MPNNSPHTVNDGTKALAKAKWLREQTIADDEVLREQTIADDEVLRLEKLAVTRTPQVESAATYPLFRKGKPALFLAKLGEDSVEAQVFVATLEAFKTAEKQKNPDGSHAKGAIKVAQEAVADQLSALFTNPETADAALTGSEWAVSSLNKAGNELHPRGAKK